jgi:polyisoprenoid-binding protein YceI
VFAENISFKGNAKFISDAPVEKINGTANGSASMSINGTDVTTMKGQITFDVKSMKTGNDMRDDHLRSPVWLDAEKYPQITFDVKSISKKGDDQFEVEGAFTLHGVSKKMKTDAQVKVMTKGGKTFYKITTSFSVSLAEYNVKGKEGVVGNKVGKEIQVKVKLRGVAG